MIEYFKEEQFLSAKKQRNSVLYWYFAIAGVFLIASVALILWYTTLPYNSPTIATVKWIHYPLTVLFVAFSFVYLGIPYKRVNRYYKLTVNLKTGIRETSTGSFFEYSNVLQDKDGVDFKALIFLEWNKFKNDFFERKVLVFDEKEFPEFKEGMNVKYVTQGNVLISYQILDEQSDEQEGE